jgi:transglutaminase superfamily protein
MTSAGRHAALLTDLPHDLAGLAAVGHGILIHEHVAPSYNVELSDTDRATVHLRRVEDLLGAITARDGRPLAEPRKPKERTPGNCRHFTVLLVTALRSQGVPARARCGFSGYLGDGVWVDHWVAEVRHGDRWVLVDAQLDDVQRELFSIDFDVTDVPRDRFLVAGEAWRRCRERTADPNLFGLGETGLWWIAGNLVRDAAALLGVELLPWDGWGAMPGPNDEIGEDLACLFDRLAELTLDPDARADGLRELCRDERLRVPSVVRNYLRQVDEPV